MSLSGLSASGYEVKSLFVEFVQSPTDGELEAQRFKRQFDFSSFKFTFSTSFFFKLADVLLSAISVNFSGKKGVLLSKSHNI